MIDFVKMNINHSNFTELQNWNDNNTIVLENLNFFWKNSDLRELKRMWDKNFSIQYMENYFKRDPDEIMLALLHMARENRISKRKYGLLAGM